jgi:hypothetical protein
VIWLRQDIVWVRDAGGRLTAFDTVRLAVSIKRAAVVVGLADWWLAESLSQAVYHFVTGNTSAESFIEAGEMATVVAAVLDRLGYAEIATAYRQRHERAEIHLDQMNTALELEFYRQLDAALGNATEADTRQVQVRGLRFCVMRLRGAQRWSNSCRQLAEEIVAHVRERAARLRPQQAAALRLAVMD